VSEEDTLTDHVRCALHTRYFVGLLAAGRTRFPMPWFGLRRSLQPSRKLFQPRDHALNIIALAMRVHHVALRRRCEMHQIGWQTFVSFGGATTEIPESARNKNALAREITLLAGRIVDAIANLLQEIVSICATRRFVDVVRMRIRRRWLAYGELWIAPYSLRT